MWFSRPPFFLPPLPCIPTRTLERETAATSCVYRARSSRETRARRVRMYYLFFYFREGPVLPTKVAGHWKVEGNPLPTRRNVPVCTASVAVGARGLGGIRGPLKLPGNRKLVLLLPFLTTPQRSRGCQIFFQNGAVIAMVELQLYDTKARGPPRFFRPFHRSSFPLDGWSSVNKARHCAVSPYG